jgi:SAM-dependent methyltransferase
VSSDNPVLAAVDREIWAFVAGLPGPSRQALISQLIPAIRATDEPAATDAAVSDQDFVRVAYDRVLARAADESGLRHYVAALAAGETRTNVVRALIRSLEFTERSNRLPRDTQLCELANPAKWDNEEWVAILRSLGLSDDRRLMHRKPYEFAQLVFGGRRLGVLRDDSMVLSVGAGHEGVLYWLANCVGRVIATDLYEGVWQQIQGREGDPNVLRNPEAYAPFAYRRDRLTFLRMDGRRLAFDAGTFDLAYSLSSIEHFGGVDNAAVTLREMGRVLRPGGIVALATEYVLGGPPHEETFHPDDFARLIDQPGLELVEPIDTGVYRRYSFKPVDLYGDPFETPHMLVRFNDTVFTTVMVFLRKG